MSGQKQLQYRFYATLLDTFQSYLDSDKIWDKYWGNSATPPHKPEEFERLQMQAVIDRINRIPFDSDAADRGTVFNEIIDCIIDGRNSEKVELKSDKENGLIVAKYNNKSFTFSIKEMREAARRYKGAVTQVYTAGTVNTKYGIVEVYGYIDEVMMDRIIDLKTTGRQPSAFSFRSHWQHRIYPLCLQQEGVDINTFVYDIYVLNVNNSIVGFSQETYIYDPVKTEAEVVDMCEHFIEFVEANRDKITDKKIFNEL